MLSLFKCFERLCTFIIVLSRLLSIWAIISSSKFSQFIFFAFYSRVGRLFFWKGIESRRYYFNEQDIFKLRIEWNNNKTPWPKTKKKTLQMCIKANKQVFSEYYHETENWWRNQNHQNPEPWWWCDVFWRAARLANGTVVFQFDKILLLWWC